MDRRKALKSIGLSFGYLAATPAVISLLQSCSDNVKINWKPVFFKKEEAAVMQKLTELILPGTEKYPGAGDLGIPQFIDAYFKEVADDHQQKNIINGLSRLVPDLRSASEDDYHMILKKYLKASENDIESFKKNTKDTSILNMLTDLRVLSVWAYKTTEKVGEEILAYDPIPGKYKGCISLEDATDGRVWSL
jgi:hypothetical protein